VLGQATGILDHETHHGPDSGISHHLTPYSILCVRPREWHPNVTLSQDSPNGVPTLSRVGVPGLWDFIAPHPDLGLGRGLNQSYSPQRELSNAMLHYQSARWEQVDSWLLVVESQTASLTPGPSFAHNLGWRCPNDPCDAIFDIYVSRNFQWHQERLNARCFGPCYWALNVRESRRTPNPQLFQVLGFTPTLWPKWGCDDSATSSTPLQMGTGKSPIVPTTWAALGQPLSDASDEVSMVT
jgi:hypothetical protein